MYRCPTGSAPCNNSLIYRHTWEVKNQCDIGLTYIIAVYPERRRKRRDATHAKSLPRQVLACHRRRAAMTAAPTMAAAATSPQVLACTQRRAAISRQAVACQRRRAARTAAPTVAAAAAAAHGNRLDFSRRRAAISRQAVACQRRRAARAAAPTVAAAARR